MPCPVCSTRTPLTDVTGAPPACQAFQVCQACRACQACQEECSTRDRLGSCCGIGRGKVTTSTKSMQGEARPDGSATSAAPLVWPDSPLRNSCNFVRACREKHSVTRECADPTAGQQKLQESRRRERGKGMIRLRAAARRCARARAGTREEGPPRRGGPSSRVPTSRPVGACASQQSGDYTAWSVNCSSKLMVTSSPRVNPPASRAAFQLTPKSWRLILVEALKPALDWP